MTADRGSDAGVGTDTGVDADGERLRVVVVDNYDSFTYNLVEYLSDTRLPGGPPEVEVVKNTASLEEIRGLDPDALVVSPGPGHPENDRDVGVSAEVLRTLSPTIPTLGVCLGLEAAVHEYGGTVGHAPEPVHGKAFAVDHDGEGVFTGLPQGFQAGRYHSLVATEVPDCFDMSATTRHGDVELVMGVRHREYPIECVQFHPESVLTAVGHDVLRNFLVECVSKAEASARLEAE
ncbi:anthranilate synthase component II [Halobium salinum]|uniref:anthranilate synthase n=1 Tax=Halobium salinum TaxID=1364940 RepID=A0ABD5P8I1_9EURY|nr:anthranilate synthase component II [Halobium salinum]